MYVVMKMKSYDQCAPYLCKIKRFGDREEALALSREWYTELGGDSDTDVRQGGRIHFYGCLYREDSCVSIIMAEC